MYMCLGQGCIYELQMLFYGNTQFKVQSSFKGFHTVFTIKLLLYLGLFVLLVFDKTKDSN